MRVDGSLPTPPNYGVSTYNAAMNSPRSSEVDPNEGDDVPSEPSHGQSRESARKRCVRTNPSAVASVLRERYEELVAGLTALNAEVDARVQLLESKEARWKTMMAEAEKNAQAGRSKIDLNVGGNTFTTTRETLLRWEGTYFHALLGSGKWEPCDDGSYFLDRNPQLFKRIMEALRTGGNVDAEGLSARQAARLREECDYFQLPLDTISNSARAEGPRWDSVRCSADLALSEGMRVVTKTQGGGWKGVLAAPPGMDSFRVRILNTRGNIMVGYAKASSFSIQRANHDHSGWFIQCGLGSLWSAFGDRGRAYCEPLKQGDLLEAQLDTEASQISFSVNGTILGVAFSSVQTNMGLLPCVELLHPGDALIMED